MCTNALMASGLVRSSCETFLDCYYLYFHSTVPTRPLTYDANSFTLRVVRTHHSFRVQNAFVPLVSSVCICTCKTCLLNMLRAQNALPLRKCTMSNRILYSLTESMNLMVIHDMYCTVILIYIHITLHYTQNIIIMVCIIKNKTLV